MAFSSYVFSGGVPLILIYQCFFILATQVLFNLPIVSFYTKHPDWLLVWLISIGRILYDWECKESSIDRMTWYSRFVLVTVLVSLYTTNVFSVVGESQLVFLVHMNIHYNISLQLLSNQLIWFSLISGCGI